MGNRGGLEQLEARETPAITATGLPTWLDAGPAPSINSPRQFGVDSALPSTAVGEVEEVEPHPTDANILFVGGSGGGVWRTLNAQATDPAYQPLTDQLPAQSVASLSLNAQNPNQLLVGVGNQNLAVLSRNGQSSRIRDDFVGAYYTDNALDPNPVFRVLGGPLAGQDNNAVLVRNGYLLVGNDAGLYRSVDDGASFTLLSGTGALPTSTNTAGFYFDLKADPANPSRVYALSQLGLFRTDNILAPTPTWANVTSPQQFIGPATANGKIAIHNSAAANVVYVVAADQASLRSVTYSTNLGATFTAMDTPSVLGVPRGVEDASNAAPIVIKSTGHGFQNGDLVIVSGVTGNLGANATFVVSARTNDNFTLTGSVGTGAYTGGGQVTKVFGAINSPFADTFLSLAADPVDPNVLYIGGIDNPADVGGVYFRGNRAVAPAGGTFFPSPQFAQISGDGSAGTNAPGDSRDLDFDAAGNLVLGTGIGAYKRLAPRDNAPFVALNGNLGLAPFYSVSYDSNNNVLFGGTQDLGGVAQLDGAGVVGNKVWDNTFGFLDSAADNTSTPGQTIRVQSGGSFFYRREVFNNQNVRLSASTVLFQADGKTDYLGALTQPDKDADFTAGTYRGRFALNKIDPRQAVAANFGLYEDDNPAGRALDTVANITPAGAAGKFSALSYGGRQSGINFPRILYVGTTTGQFYFRGTVGGLTDLTALLPGTGEINQIVTDPDDFRNVFVLRGNNQVYSSADAGQTWSDITQNLIAPGLDANGNPILYQTDPATGAVTGGLSTQIHDIAIYDTAQNGLAGGGTVLLASGRSGVFRFVPGLAGAQLPNQGWTEYGTGLPNAYAYDLDITGNRLTVGLNGRGAYVIPDISGTIRVAAVVQVAAEGAAGFVTLGPDPNNPFNLLATDGVGNAISVARSTAASFRLVGGGGADTFFISGGDTSTLGFLQSAVNVDAGNEANAKLVISDTNRFTPTRVTVTATSVGAGKGDNIFSNVPGSRVNYAGFGNGQVVLDLGTQAVNGNQVNVEGTSAGTTFVFGTRGQDTFFVNGTASGNGLGNLNAVFGTLNFEGRAGAGDVLVVSDYGATAGNQVGRLAGNQILGLAGVTDASVINYFNVGSVAVFGSNSAALAEQFTVASPAAPTSLFAGAGPDTINVQSTAAGVPVGVFGGAGDDLIRVTSTAGSGDFGNLLGINGPLNIDAEAGANRLIVSNGGSAFPATFTITANSISGASPQPINYTATGGNFLGGAGDGISVLGSDAAGDTFNVVSTRAGSQTLISGNGGNDQFNAATQNLNGVVRLSGGFGSDSFVLDPGDFGSTAAPLVVSGGGGGTDRALFLGFAGDDLFPPAVTVTSATAGVVTGLGAPVGFDTLTNLDYDGRTGRNNFTFVDGTGVARGSTADPGAGIVVQPKSVAAAEIRLGGGTVGPVVNVTNVNGSDAAGLLIDGRGRDTLTVLGASGTGLGGTGALANTVSDTGTDTITVSEQVVTIRNLDLGDLRSVAVARFDTGIPLVLGALTIPTLIVRAGDESGAGDNVAVTPSSNVNIIVDGGLPGRGRNGDVITSNGGEPTTVARSNDPATGQQVTRLVTPSGKSAQFQNFENAGGGRQIFAVGADAGGGPRVRVYDAQTRAVLFDNFVYEESFTGGVRVATGDVTGDGVPDLVVAAGYGGGPRITVFDGVNFSVVADFFAFEASFRGGAYVAVGDLTGDGVGRHLGRARGWAAGRWCASSTAGAASSRGSSPTTRSSGAGCAWPRAT